MLVSVGTRDGPGSQSEGKGPDGRQAITQLNSAYLKYNRVAPSRCTGIAFPRGSFSHIVLNTILIISLSSFWRYHKFRIYYASSILTWSAVLVEKI